MMNKAQKEIRAQEEIRAQNEVQVQKEYLNLTVPIDSLTKTKDSLPGYELESKAKVKLFFYKGNSISHQEYYVLDRLLMFRLKLKLEGNFKDTMPLDFVIVKDTIEDIDIDFTLIDMFFRRKYTKWKTLKILGPIREKYFGITKIGDYIGTVFMDYREFLEFTKWMHYLIQEPMKRDNVL